jgi:low affinity Fe/Cu permease
MNHLRAWLTFIGVSTAHPGAFGVVALYVALWLVFDPQSFNWGSIATIATWIMTLFIQRAEYRDTQAIHA